MSRPRLVALLLALLTLLFYLPATRHGFSAFDDSDYVTNNRVVQNGLTWAGVQWAFTTWHASNWHPLTWLSHMLDCELFGLNPAAHHFVNIVLHAANAVLLFVLLRRLTRTLWPAAFVAALFAWHPLRVESVAWIAERKDVLSTFFALLTLLAYVRAVTDASARTRPTIFQSRFYWLAVLCFALGLLAKPMLVTLPLVMLLLDYWPLGRMPGARPGSALCRLAVEKIPFLLLVVGSCAITLLAQNHGGMVVSLEEMPLGYRLCNVPLAYCRYLEKMVWPVPLSILYPLPHGFSPALVAAAVMALAAATFAAWRMRRRQPYLLVGWLWFLGTLVPVIGLVQVGQVAMSDRYSYFPLIGLFLIIAFAVKEAATAFHLRPALLAAGAGLVLAACVLLTERQLTYWRDDIALFGHAAEVTRDNEAAHVSLGLALETAGRKLEALQEYRTGLKLKPYRAKTYKYIALVLADQGRTNEALATLHEAARVQPADSDTHATLARLLAESGRNEEAVAEFQAALQRDPANVTTLDSLGLLLASLGRLDEAMDCFAQAGRLAPGSWQPPFLTGLALLKQHRDRDAILPLRQALEKDPANIDLLIYLARLLAADENANVRDGPTALALATQANALADGEQPAALDVLAMAYAEAGRFDDAQKTAQEAIQVATGNGQTNDLASLQSRLALYQAHQPYRQSFADTALLGPLKP